MATVLITSGPTREFLDPVRFLSNASSGRMGSALAEAFCTGGHRVIVVSGPVAVDYPRQVELISVITTEEMLKACQSVFPECDGVIGAAAPCDFRPEQVASHKILKSGSPLTLRLVETPDILANLGMMKQHQWIVGFALETHDARQHALEKIRKKRCDLMVVNRPSAIGADWSSVEVLDPQGICLAEWTGTKTDIAYRLRELIEQRFWKLSGNIRSD
ncbi:phosphopantothenoylcysteine decarboxylase [Thermogutta sp.]|uniref:phosphopantothenoylcysteine decarboxylase n=1 Tax=Thermogutta sp. TaxID=1962930 RepID=UPI0032203DD8